MLGRVMAIFLCFVLAGCGAYPPLSDLEHVSSSVWDELLEDGSRAVVTLPPAFSSALEDE